MAFAQRTTVSTRAMTAVVVAGLHGVALYGLVSGLAVDYVKDVVTVLRGENIPAELPPPPPAPPEQMPSQSASSETASQPERSVVIDTTPLPLSTNDPVTTFPTTPPGPLIDEPVPRVTPAPEKPVFNPQGVRPRNDPRSWVSTDDYPTGALRRGDQGTVGFTLSVRPDGRVADCRVTRSSGSPDLDAATCKNASRRARFEPAMDESGRVTAGTYTGSIRWVIPQG